METNKKVNIEVSSYINSYNEERWIASLCYGTSITGRPLKFKTYGNTLGQAVARMGKLIKREGVPLP